MIFQKVHFASPGHKSLNKCSPSPNPAFQELDCALCWPTEAHGTTNQQHAHIKYLHRTFDVLFFLLFLIVFQLELSPFSPHYSALPYPIPSPTFNPPAYH